MTFHTTDVKEAPRQRWSIAFRVHPMWWLIPGLFAGISLWAIAVNALLGLFL